MGVPAKTQKFHRMSSVQVIARRFRRLASFAADLEETQETELLPDEFDHLKIGDVRQFSIGIVFLFSIAACTAMINNVAKNTATLNFRAPSFVLWIRSFFRVFAFPLYLLLRWAYEFMFQKGVCTAKTSLLCIFRESRNIYGDRKVSLGKFFRDVMILGALTAGSQYLSFAPLLASLSTGNLAALGASSIVFVYFLSVVFLKIDIIAPKVFGVIFAAAGVGLLLTEEIRHNSAWNESIIILAGAGSTAIYQVTYRLLIGGTTNLGRISFSVTLQALATVVLMWPLVLTLNLTGVERWRPNELPWEMLLKGSASSFALVILINLGVAFSNPFFTSLGFLMTVPFTYTFDVLWNGHCMMALESVGSLLVCLGVVMLVFAEVITWEYIKREGKNISGNAKRLRKFVEKSVDAKTEKTIQINDKGTSFGMFSHFYPNPEILTMASYSQNGRFTLYQDR